MFKEFYKVIIVAVDLFESHIIDERHFSDRVAASQYADAMKHQDYVAVLVQM